jgi:TonB-linked SusC/RagA family outer membrane protein
MRKLFYNALGIVMAFLLCLEAQAQRRPVSGTVTDSAGAPIPNVSVRIRSTKAGVATNENGVFKISASPSDVLLFSNIGFSDLEVKVGNRENLTVVMGRNAQSLNEVTVTTALGIKRTRNSVAYATQQISGDAVTRTMNTNFVDNMSGKVAGLQITSSNTMGGSNNVILRGMKSLTQNNQALFVVDGVPYDNTNQSMTNTGGQGYYDLGNGASDINPNDIESISVLKGAAASALYGSRGSNGVILITTKRGSRLNKGLGVTVNFGVNAGTPDQSTLPQYQLQYGEGYGASGGGTGNPNQYFYYQPVFNSNGSPVLIVQTDVDQMTGPAYDPTLKVYQWDAFSPGNPNYGKATAWQPAAHYKPTDYFVTPVSTSTSVFADGGSDKGTFKIGFTHSNDKGYLPNSNEAKNLLTLGVTHNLLPNLTVGGEFNYSDINATGRYGYGYYGGNGTQINPMTDFRQWWETGIDLKAQKADFFRTMSNATWNWLGGYTTNVPGTIVKPAYHDNPYWVRYKNYETDGRTRYFGNAFITYKPTSWLNILGRVSRDNYNQIVETRYDVGSAGTPLYGKTLTAYGETNYDLLVNFDKNIGTDFNVKALLGGNIRQNTISSTASTTNGGLVVPGFFALANSVNTPNAPTETFYRKEVDGIFAGATITYKEMITVDGTIRRDKSSTLPVANNSYYYPAISANWIFSKLMDVPWLTYGKLRANYASVGGDAPYFSLQNTYAATAPFNGQTVFNMRTTNNNPNLVPEMNHTYEIGAELSFLKSRVGLDVTYYHAQSINQIMPINVSTASGYSQFYVNGGTVQNQGVELSLNLTPVRLREFSWDMNINWAMNKSKVLSLYQDQPSFIIAKYQNSVQLVAEKGQPYGVLRGTNFTYLNGKPLVDTSGYYVKQPNALSDIGNISPKWIGGVNNTFRYKSVSLSFLIDVKKGGDIYSLDLDYGASAGLTPHTAGYNRNGKPVRASLTDGGGYLMEGVTADGKANSKLVDASDINAKKFPFSSDNQEVAREYVYDAGYIKLREVAITWSVPAAVISKWHFVKGIDLSLTGRNLWIIHKNLPYADPEQGVPASGSYGANASMGFQSGSYPVFRTFGFNVKAKF